MIRAGRGTTAFVHPSWLSIHRRAIKYTKPARGASLDDGTFAARLRLLSTHNVNILRSRCEGLASPAIARRYGVSDQTIKNHFTLIFRKLGLSGEGKSARACYLLGESDAEGRKARRLMVVSAAWAVRGSGMSEPAGAVTWWTCAVTEPKNRPELRLATAIELAVMHGLATNEIHVHPTMAETRAPAGVVVVCDEHEPVNQFRFARKGE